MGLKLPAFCKPITLPDWQAAWRDKAVADEREACARLAEEHGAHATAVEIRARDGVTPTSVSGNAREGARPFVLDPALAHVRAMPSVGPAIEAASEKLMRDNPPPPDALLPDGCSRWWPRVDVDERDGKTLARLTWEAKP